MPLENPVSLLEHGRWTGLWYNEGTEAYELASMVGPEAGLPPSAFAAGQAPLTPHRLTEHATADRAAIVTLRYYLGPTLDYTTEYGGFICKLGTARYSASIANVGTSSSVTPRRCGFTFRSVSWESAGVYHTHTDVVDPGFSGPDALGAKTSVDTSNPAIDRRRKTGHHRRATETTGFYFGSGSGRKSVATFVRQLRGPHFSTCA